MDEVIAFMKQFAQVENEALLADRSNPSDKIVQEKMEKLYEFYDRLNPDINPSAIRDKQFFKEQKESLVQIKPRTLFLVKHYKHPQLGDLYRCYTSGNQLFGFPPMAPSYFANMYVANKKGKLKIISKYLTCMYCRSLGTFDGEKCADCKGEGWEYFGGVKLKTLGKLLETRKLQPPASKKQLEQYNTE